MTRDNILAILRAHRAELAALGVKPLALFGSFARDEARPDSEVDLVVDFDGPPTFRQYMGSMQHVIVHGYFALALDTIWDIVHNHLPTLTQQVKQILAEWPEP